MRVAFHPPDALWPGVLASCPDTVRALLEQRDVISYRELIARAAGARAA